MRQNASALFFIKGKPITVVIAPSSGKSRGTRQYQSRQIYSQNKKKGRRRRKKDFHSNREIKLIKAWVNATSNEGNKITRTLKW